MTSHRAQRFALLQHDTLTDLPLDAFHAHVKRLPLNEAVAARLAAISDGAAATVAAIVAADPEPDLDEPGDGNVHALPPRDAPVSVEDRARAAANALLRYNLPYRQITLDAIDGEPVVFIVVRGILDLRRWAGALNVRPARRNGRGRLWDHARGTRYGATIDVTTDSRSQRDALQAELANLARLAGAGDDIGESLRKALDVIDDERARVVLCEIVRTWGAIVAGHPEAVADYFGGLAIDADTREHAKACALSAVAADLSTTLDRVFG